MDTEVFVDRKKELEQLKSICKFPEKKEKNIIFIEGEAGVGKTALLSKFTASEQCRPLYYYWSKAKFGNSPSFQTFIDLFKMVLKENEDEKNPLKEDPIPTGKRDGLFNSYRKSKFYEAKSLIKDIKEEEPLVFILEDLQWVDKSSLNLLEYLADTLREENIFFICSYRPGDVGKSHPVTETIQSVSRKKLFQKIELEPFDMEKSEELISKMLETTEIQDRFSEEVHKKCGGNPLLIKESIIQLVEEDFIDLEEEKYAEQLQDVPIPNILKQVVSRRMRDLSWDTIEVLQLCSVVGESISFELLKSMTSKDELELIDILEDLIEKRILKEGEDPEYFYFKHAAIANIIYDGLGRWLERKRLHRKVARGYEEHYSESLENMYPILARHWHLAEQSNKAYEYYIKSGKKSEERLGYEDAVEKYESALSLHPEIEIEEDESIFTRVELLDKIGKLLLVLGEYEKSREYLEKAIDAVDEPDKKQELMSKSGETFSQQGKYEEALDIFERAIDIGLDEGMEKSEVTCSLYSKKGMIFARKGEYDKARKIFEKEHSIARELDNLEVKGQSYHDLGIAHLYHEDHEKAIERFNEAIEIREEVEDFEGLSDSYNNLGVIYSDLNERDKALDYYRRALRYYKKIGDIQGMAGCFDNIGVIHLNMGRYDKALNAVEKALENRKKVGARQGIAISLGNLAEIYRKKGDLKRSKKNCKKSLEIAEDLGDKHGIAIMRRNLALIYYYKNDLDKAIEEVEKSKDICEEMDNETLKARSEVVLTDSLREKGRTQKAFDNDRSALDGVRNSDTDIALVETLSRLITDHIQMGKEGKEKEALIQRLKEGSKSSELPEVEAESEEALGRYHLYKKEYGSALEHFKKQLKIATEIENPIIETEARYQLAKLWDEKGDEDKKVEQLERARKISSEIGYDLLLNKIEERFTKDG